MELGYGEIRDMLRGDALGAAVNGGGGTVILQAERIDGEPVYTAMWESKRAGRTAWLVKHWYHADGTVEETFYHEPLGR